MYKVISNKLIPVYCKIEQSLTTRILSLNEPRGSKIVLFVPAYESKEPQCSFRLEAYPFCEANRPAISPHPGIVRASLVTRDNGRSLVNSNSCNQKNPSTNHTIKSAKTRHQLQLSLVVANLSQCQVP